MNPTGFIWLLPLLRWLFGGVKYCHLIVIDDCIDRVWRHITLENNQEVNIMGACMSSEPDVDFSSPGMSSPPYCCVNISVYEYT